MHGPCSDVESRAHLRQSEEVGFVLLAFPSDPIIETSASLVVGETATVICKIRDVFPSDHLELLLKKDEQILHRKTFEGDVSTKTETKTVAYSFNLTTEDNGKEIVCVARLQIAGMDFEPKERLTSLKLNANCKCFYIRVFISNTILCCIMWNGFMKFVHL